MKKVLIVAYHFPPSNAVGALRPAKFAEYLPEFGWEPIVLAGDEEAGVGAQFGRVDGIELETVESWPGLRDLARMVSRRIRSIRPEKTANAKSASDAAGAEAGWRTDYLESGTRRNVVRDFIYSLMWLPDDRQGWIIPAICAGLRTVRASRPDVVLVTSPPHSVQVVGLLLARLTGLPLVSDFRDPWTGNPATPDFIRTGPTRQIHDILEAQVLRTSTAITTTTRAHAEALARNRPGIDEKLRVIPNGFDPAAFEGIPAKPIDPRRFTITYAGSFYHTRTPRPLLEAIAFLRDERGIDPTRIRLNFVGNCEFAGTENVREMARDLDLEECLTMPGRVPYRQALEYLVRSDLLLLLASGQPIQIPAKAYEYAAAGPPILALVEPGATAEFLEEAAEADIIFDATPAKIAAAVASRLGESGGRESAVWRPPPTADRYNRRVIARDLARLLDEARAA